MGTRQERGWRTIDTDALQMIITSDSTQAINGLNALIQTLERLKTISQRGAGLNTVANSLAKLNTALAGTSVNSAKIREIADSLSPLSSLGKVTGLNSAINALKKLPEISKQLENTNMDKFANQIRLVATTMKPLADEMQKVSAGFAAFPIRIQKIIQSSGTLGTSNVILGKSFNGLSISINSVLLKLGAIWFMINRVGQAISGFVTKSNQYVENLNLYTVVMGKYAESGLKFAQKVQETMGIDMASWIRYEAVFMSLSKGFGNMAESSAFMARNLTQLGYDLGSLFNINFDDTMLKLQSAFAGELEPVRRLGYDLSQARAKLDAEQIATAHALENLDFSDLALQSLAIEKGINVTVSTLTQAEKSILRYIQLMTQMPYVHGDFGRTINSTANQLRIFTENINLFARAMGNMFIPMLNKALPPLIATVKILTMMANQFANLLGFELPEFDYADLLGQDDMGSILEENFDDATDAAKRLKSVVAGFDELNILSDTNSESGAGNQVLIDALTEMQKNGSLPGYDFFKNFVETDVTAWVEKLKPMIDNIILSFLILGSTLATLNLVGKIGVWAKGFESLSLFAGSFATQLSGWGATIATALNPVTLGITAVLLVIGGLFYSAWNNSEELRTKLSLLGGYVKDTFIGLWNQVEDVFGRVWESVKQLWETGLKPLWNSIVTALTPVFIVLVDLLTWLWKYVITPLAGAVVGILGESFVALVDFFTKWVIPIVLNVIGAFLWLWNNVLVPVAGVLYNILQPAFETVFSVIGGVIDTFRGAIEGIITFISGVFTLDWEKAWGGIELFFTSLWNGLRDTVDDVMKGISSIIDGIVEAWNNMVELVTKPFKTQTADVIVKAGNELDVQIRATGGVIEDGLFTMNRGEMAGTFNNGTSIVANNEQIVEGIAEGVYGAVLAAMSQSSGNGGTQEFNIYLSGKELTTQVEKVQKERGLSLVGNQLGGGRL